MSFEGGLCIEQIQARKRISIFMEMSYYSFRCMQYIFLVVSHSYFFQFWCSTTSKDFTAWAEHRLTLLSLWQIIWIHRQVYNASHNKSSLTVICQDTRISCHGYLVPKHWAVMISISLIPKEISLQYVLEWVCIYIVCRESNVCAWVCWTRCVPR